MPGPGRSRRAPQPKTFYRWASEPDPETGKLKRKRVLVGRWSLDGGNGTITLGDARDTLIKAREEKRDETDGTAERTVAQIAQQYRTDILSHRERADEAWNVIRVHIVEAQPDPRRPPFGEWVARQVKASTSGSWCGTPSSNAPSQARRARGRP